MPPTLFSIGDKSVNEGQLLEFAVTATDPNGDSLSLTAAKLPSGATFTDKGDGTAWPGNITHQCVLPV